MEVIDTNAWFGRGMLGPLPGSPDEVVDAARAVGIDRVCLTPLDAIWYHNPHLGNDELYRIADRRAAVLPVPLLDPTIASWADELALAVTRQAAMVKLAPAYSGYEPAAAEPLLAAAEAAVMPVVVQVRVEDPRYHHPRARVPDADVAAIARLAGRRPRLRLVLGGASTAALLAVAHELRDLAGLFADLSQADGLDAVRRLVDAGLLPKLLFATHAPLFAPLAGLARVLPELDDVSAAAVLGGNARRLLRL